MTTPVTQNIYDFGVVESSCFLLFILHFIISFSLHPYHAETEQNEFLPDESVNNEK